MAEEHAQLEAPASEAQTQLQTPAAEGWDWNRLARLFLLYMAVTTAIQVTRTAPCAHGALRGIYSCWHGPNAPLPPVSRSARAATSSLGRTVPAGAWRARWCGQAITTATCGRKAPSSI